MEESEAGEERRSPSSPPPPPRRRPLRHQAATAPPSSPPPLPPLLSPPSPPAPRRGRPAAAAAAAGPAPPRPRVSRALTIRRGPSPGVPSQRRPARAGPPSLQALQLQLTRETVWRDREVPQSRGSRTGETLETSAVERLGGRCAPPAVAGSGGWGPAMRAAGKRRWW